MSVEPWNEAIEGAMRWVRHEYPEAVARIEAEAARSADEARQRVEKAARTVLDERDAAEKDWLEWWARGGKGNFVWPRKAHEALRDALNTEVR